MRGPIFDMRRDGSETIIHCTLKIEYEEGSQDHMARRRKLINNTNIPQYEIEKIARILLPDIQAYYDSEEGQREFAEWKAAQDRQKTDECEKQ